MINNEDNNIVLFNLVKLHLENNESPTIVNKFVNDSIFIDITKQSNVYQKFMLNRYFSNLLFMFRDEYDIAVHNVVIFLITEGTIEDWFKCFVKFVYPFLKEYHVLQKMLA